MTDSEESEILAAINGVRASVRAVEGRMDGMASSIDAIRETSAAREKRLTDEIEATRFSLRAARETAESAKKIAESTKHEANVVFEAMKQHNNGLEKQLRGFEKTLGGVAEESRVQTSTLAELACEAEARTLRGQETQAIVKQLLAAEQARVTAEQARASADAVTKALQEDREKRQETTWKRLPVYVSIAVLATGALGWFVTSTIAQRTPPTVIVQPVKEK